jgi:hypothetical protein
MRRELVIITSDEAFVKVIQRLVAKFDVRTQSFPKILSLRDLSYVPDLIVFHDTTDISMDRKQIVTGRYLRDKRSAGSALVWIAAHDAEMNDKTILAGVDSVYPNNSIQSEEFRTNLIQLLYQRTRSGTQRSIDTENVWKFMASRAAGIFVGELVRAITGTRNILSWSESSSPRLTKIINSELSELLSDPDFILAIADRQFAELPPLFWVCLSEALIDHGNCNFDDFGEFQKGIGKEGAHISSTFTASFVELLVPRLDASTEGLSKALSKGIDSCIPSMMVNLDRTITKQSAMRSTFVSLYASTLQDADKRFRQDQFSFFDEEFVVKNIQSKENESNRINLLSGAAAFAGYYFHLVSVSRMLHESGRIAIPMIGEFAMQESAVRFEPSSDLLELIGANPEQARPKTMVAGA